MLHTLQSHDIRKMPYCSALHLHTVCATLGFISFTVPFITKQSPCGRHKEERLHGTGLLYCSETSRFQSLQSDVTRLPLSCSLLSEWPAVTLHMSLPSLFLVQTVLDRGALKHIYKGQEIATFRWRDIKCLAWIHVWTGLLGIFHCLCVCQSFPSLIKYKT